MQTLLFVSFDQQTRTNFSLEAAAAVSQFDLFSKDCQEDGGIDIVRSLKTFTTRKPTQSEYNLIVLSEAQHLTPEAQNALLKILEEPPLFTKIVLTAPSTSTLLPTVVSRCQIQEPTEITERAPKEFDWLVVNEALTGTDAVRLKIADTLDWDKWFSTWQELLIQKINNSTINSTYENLSLEIIQKYLKKLLRLTKMGQEHASSKLINQNALLSCPKIES